jgi:hypothetical protein
LPRVLLHYVLRCCTRCICIWCVLLFTVAPHCLFDCCCAAPFVALLIFIVRYVCCLLRCLPFVRFRTVYSAIVIACCCCR